MPRVLAFMWPGQECWAVFQPIQRLLELLGYEVGIANFGHHVFGDAEGERSPRLSLFDRREDEIPRTSARQYAMAGGPDVDFAASAAYYHLVGGFSDDPEWLFDDGAYYQRLRTVALRAKHLIEMFRPDLAIIGHGANPLPAVVARVCCEAGLPVCYFESSFIPGRILLDSEGMHFFPGVNRIDRRWPSIRDTAGGACSGRLAAFLDDWKGSRLSKYAQPEDPEEVALAEELLAGAERDQCRAFFMPEQIPWDASVLLGLGRFSSWTDFVRHVAQCLPEGARVLVKRHPKQREPIDYRALLGNRAVTVSRVNIHRAIAGSDAVVTFSSNAGLEALLLGKPVICGGSPHYAGKGFTIDLDGSDSDAYCFAQPDLSSPGSSFNRYADHVIFEYLIDRDSPQALAERLAEAGVGVSPQEAYPLQCADYLCRIKAYSCKKRKNAVLTPVPGARRDRLLEGLSPWMTDAERVWDASLGGPLPQGQETFDLVVLAGALCMAGDALLLLDQAWDLLRPGGLLLVAERHPDLNVLEGDDVSLLDPKKLLEELRLLPVSEEVQMAGSGLGGRLEEDLWRAIYVGRVRKQTDGSPVGGSEDSRAELRARGNK